MVNIAVVTPVFNTQDYLHRCIKSILGQKGVSIQYFIVDDGSTDNSASIARFYQQKDSRVTFIQKVNEGQGVARNIGIKLADAEYIYFVDSDDYLGENVLSILYKTAKDNNLDICSPSVPKHYFDKPLENVPCLPCKSQFIKLSIIRDNNLLQPSISSGQDGVFSHLVLTHCTRIGMNEHASFFYTHAREGSTFAAHLKRHDLVPLLLEQHYDVIEQHYDLFNLWETNAIRLFMFISDESLRNRFEPHLPFMDSSQKKSCFITLSKIAKKIGHFITEKQKKYLPPSVLALCTHEIDWLIDNYEKKFCGKTVEVNFDKSCNIYKEKLIITKYNDINLMPNKKINNQEKKKVIAANSYDPTSSTSLGILQNEIKVLNGKIDLAINTINNATTQVSSALHTSPSILQNGNSDIVVSLTTLPHRLNLVHLAIESIFNQTLLPSRVILWITEKIDVSKNITPQLDALIARGLEIRKVEDIGPHTKLIYALKEFPDKNIITIDDDIIYPNNTISCLWDRHNKYPKAVVCNWARELVFSSAGKVKGVRSGRLMTPPRLEYELEQALHFDEKPSFLGFPYGTSGVLYPPNSLSLRVFEVDLFKKLCPKEDDIWFKAMGLLNKTPIVVTNLGINPSHHCITGSQSEALRHDNHGLQQNQKQMEAVFQYFDLYSKISFEI